jgi:prephenate dehydratase
VAGPGEPPDRFAPEHVPLKTSIVFWGLADSPGALVDVLQEFAGREVNLSKIESRPRKQGLGRYIFFADLEGGETEPRIVAALTAVRRSVETLRVLGCYPAAPQRAVT